VRLNPKQVQAYMERGFVGSLKYKVSVRTSAYGSDCGWSSDCHRIPKYAL